MSFFDYLFAVLTKFGGGAGGPPNELVRFLLAAIFFAFLDDFLMLFNLASAEVYAPIYGPIRHNLHLWAVPLLGYVYFREQANELQAADATLKATLSSRLCVLL